MEISNADIEFVGEIVDSTSIFGNAEAETLLGVTALESVGTEVDPADPRLKRLPAVSLENTRA